MARLARKTAAIKNEILIIDDSRENLHLLSELLRQEGYCVRCATGGKMALNSIQFARPNLILLDIMMPDMDGFEVYRLLKVDSWTARIPVIFVSALDIPLHLEQGLLIGGLDYLKKPYRLNEISVKVQAALVQ